MPNSADSVEPVGEQPLLEGIAQGGMELDLAEVNRDSTSDNDRGKRLTACPGTLGTNLAARRCVEDQRRERLGPDERSLGSQAVHATSVSQDVEDAGLSLLQSGIARLQQATPATMGETIE